MMKHISMILMDIEGTTTDIHFVHDVLFPFSFNHMDSFLKRKSLDFATQEAVAAALLIHKEETQEELPFEKAGELFKKWIKEDRKIKPLKDLQGFIWQEGYLSKELHSHVYKDVPECFELWTKKHIRLGIYSSGSVYAQKLLFANTIFGDLTSFITNFFDTSIGTKKEASSYKKIATACRLPEKQICFLSDIKEELEAASDAGMQTALLVRDEKSPLKASYEGLRLSSFDQLPLFY